MKKILLFFTFFTPFALAQTTDAQLLAAQIAFQEARDASTKANKELNEALKNKEDAEQKLLAAQNALDAANERLRAANVSKAERDVAFKNAIQRLDEIWLIRQKSL